ncbi:pirin family protein [Sphingobacterium paramultivorum]|uniref:Pirin family protein n=1 Tax=Sphingobacterium paramultivorum TaxID=2886510 RepID=A0A7G5EA07_9SPHI|nr:MULTISPECIES: pirin family protein [Sphingobacterium]MCS4164233.1 redox-sensitive bicupin YhaK (pirin superfamily) [Sphingobacterium sp. BIGb0116]QMV70832.1 pirin family protein [Sphingobacterium paramultivorum]WSO14711.1 pirin family protein [Sphingobacterium paramultivorum]
MNRQNFIKKGLLGSGIFASTVSSADILKNDIDEIEPLETLDAEAVNYNSDRLENHSVLHKAATRGHANHGWLDSNHTFSFANYHNPERMHFGVLRVLNDDMVAEGRGFGKHPHDNMEIISIPLEGDLQHEDSMGNKAIIRKGDIQVMSAGTGIIHSEYNKNTDQVVKFLQIWVYPNQRNVSPRYDQITLDITQRQNKFQQILSPNPEDEGVWIHQDAWFSMGHFDKDVQTKYQIKKAGNGVYVFVIKGSVTVEGQELESRDGFGIWDVAEINLKVTSADTEILLMDLSMILD